MSMPKALSRKAEKDAIKRYSELRSLRETAKEFGVSYGAIRRLLKRRGREDLLSADALRRKKTVHGGELVKWVERHPEVKLPRDYKAIAQRTGCSYDSVRQYYSRQRRAMRNVIKQIGDLRRYPLLLPLRNGTGRLSTMILISYKVAYDPFSLRTYITGRLAQGESVRFKPLSFEELLEIKEKVYR